jgi:hypothetical protein
MSTRPLDLVPYQRDVHEESYLRLLSGFFGGTEGEERRRVLATFHERMPGRERVPLRHVVVDGNRVAASLGHMPAEFWIQGERVPVRYTHDLLVDSEYRGVHSLGKRLVTHALTCGDFFPGGLWMTHPSFRLHELCGFTAVKEMTTYTLVLDPAAFVARKGFAGTKKSATEVALRVPREIALRIARAHSARGGDELAIVERFDSAWDVQWATMARGYGITRFRDADYLNWKYAEHPYLPYQLFLARRGGGEMGFVIWRLAPNGAAEKRAVVVDFLVANTDASTFRFLMSHVIRAAAEAGMESLSVLTTQSWAARALLAFGFFPRGTRNTWVVGNWENRIPKAWLGDHRPWHMCLGDSDGDMWTSAG